MEQTFHFTSIAEFHKVFGLTPPEHPLVSLIDYSQVKYPEGGKELKWVQHFYSIGLKRNINARFNYGQQEYDFDAGVLVPPAVSKTGSKSRGGGGTQWMDAAHPPGLYLEYRLSA